MLDNSQTFADSFWIIFLPKLVVSAQSSAALCTMWSVSKQTLRRSRRSAQRSVSEGHQSKFFVHTYVLGQRAIRPAFLEYLTGGPDTFVFIRF